VDEDTACNRIIMAFMYTSCMLVSHSQFDRYHRGYGIYMLRLKLILMHNLISLAIDPPPLLRYANTLSH
jgi:hypothetical protein